MNRQNSFQPHGIKDSIHLQRSTILALLEKHGAFHPRIFGSVARGEESISSDLDLLVEFQPKRSLLDRIALIQDLEDLLGINVDVVTTPALHPKIQQRVAREAIPL